MTRKSGDVSWKASSESTDALRDSPPESATPPHLSLRHYSLPVSCAQKHLLGVARSLLRIPVMRNMDLSLVCAVPVHVVDLGASLQAYIDALPALTTLRLCNRYGKGEAAFINKLPVELVKLVEQHVVQPLREQHRVSWNRDHICFEQKCKMLDHLTSEEKLDIYYELTDFHSICTNGDDLEDPSEEKVNRTLEGRCADGFDMCWDEHFERRGAWEDRVARDNSTNPSFFDRHKGLVTSHFGIEIWRSIVRLPSNSEAFMGDYDSADTTVTYLTMPNPRARSERWALSNGEIESGIFGCESGYGVPIAPGQPPSAKSLRRFGRAMKILDLKVFVHESQNGQVLTQPAEDCDDIKTNDKAAYAVGSWPQLTLLTRSTVLE